MNPPELAIALHAGVRIEGLVGETYGIQYTTDLSQTAGWTGVANVVLTQPAQVWYDPQPAAQAQRYYRCVPGPISVP